MGRPTIVIAHFEGFSALDETALDRLDTIGELLDRKPLHSWDEPRAQELLGSAEVIVGHWGCPLFGPAFFGAATNLRLFAYAAGSVKWYLSDELWERNILVTTCADANAEPVAEYTLAMILLANKGVFPAIDRESHRTAWTPPADSAAHGNWDKTIGLVSVSLTGRRVAQLLQPFDHLRVQIYDPYVDAETIEALGATKQESLVDLCAQADVLSIHAPALPDTHNLIGETELAALRNGTTVINTSRGHCLDLDALTAELESQRLFGIIDVTDPVEPLPPTHPLRTLPNAVLTPHVAGSQGTELARLGESVIDEVERYAKGEPLRNPVTREMVDRIA
ncbi:MAG: hydroxyacid dehydrogenase [Acidimicrobiaceae bacterium]|nr:hydroxyacid dehydrogenase [Acidimicrobiaceae bacterium]